MSVETSVSQGNLFNVQYKIMCRKQRSYDESIH